MVQVHGSSCRAVMPKPEFSVFCRVVSCRVVSCRIFSKKIRPKVHDFMSDRAFCISVLGFYVSGQASSRPIPQSSLAAPINGQTWNIF